MVVPASLSRSLGPYLAGEGGNRVPLEEVVLSLPGPGPCQTTPSTLSRDRENVNIKTSKIGKNEQKIIGLFFTREGSGECRSASETLQTLYYNLKSNVTGGSRLEVVLVSSDEDEMAFQRQFQTMPWLAVPFGDMRRRIRLARQYRVHALPTLILVESLSGKVVSNPSWNEIRNDPQGTRFPWRTSSLRESLNKAHFIDRFGQATELSKGYLGLYFSANWCPPCKAFTPQLIDTYQKIKQKFEFEVLFVSSDRSESSYQNYRSLMPWPSITFEDEYIREELPQCIGVSGIPTLVILDENLKLLTKDGRSKVNEDPDGKNFPWIPNNVEILKEFHLNTILERPALVLFAEGEPDDVRHLRDILLPAAEEYLAELPAEGGMEMSFYVAGDDEASDRLRDLADLEDVAPLLVILDIAEGTKYVMEESAQISNASVHNFIKRYTNDSLQPQFIQVASSLQAEYNFPPNVLLESDEAIDRVRSEGSPQSMSISTISLDSEQGCSGS